MRWTLLVILCLALLLTANLLQEQYSLFSSSQKSAHPGTSPNNAMAHQHENKINDLKITPPDLSELPVESPLYSDFGDINQARLNLLGIDSQDSLQQLIPYLKAEFTSVKSKSFSAKDEPLKAGASVDLLPTPKAEILDALENCRAFFDTLALEKQSKELLLSQVGQELEAIFCVRYRITWIAASAGPFRISTEEGMFDVETYSGEQLVKQIRVRGGPGPLFDKIRLDSQSGISYLPLSVMPTQVIQTPVVEQ